jgi:prepilin-type N-terminal cleavage/methylation domain-containing protein
MRLNTTDDGFTLIELLVAIVILGVIAAPLANVVITAISGTGTTADRLALSNDAQLSATYFAQDVASMGIRDYTNTQAGTGTVPYKASIQLNAAYNAGGLTCGTTPPETTGTAVVRFLADDWNTTVSPPVVTTDIVAYYLVPVGTVDELHRIKCVAGSATPLYDMLLATDVDPNTVAVICSSTCGATPVPQQVTLAFSVTRASASAYPISLNGQRRQS